MFMGPMHYMGYGFYGSYIFPFLIVLIVTLLILFIIFKEKKNSIFENELEMLSERYVREEISFDEFREKKAIIENLENSNPALISLVDRYVKGEINSKKFFEFLAQIEK
jgi:uncharacterized membrane protein